MRKKIALAVILLFVGILFGYYLGSFTTIETVSSEIPNLSASFTTIFFKNLFTCILIIVGFGVITIPITILQGIYIGFSSGVIASQSMSYNYLILIIPHAILEIPALIISVSLGLEMFQTVKKVIKGEKKMFKSYYNRHRWKLFLIILLLFFSAVTECFITPKIYQLWGRF